MVVDGCHDIWFPSHATDDFFKAGAKWQKEQIIKRLCNHANIDQMVEKFEDKYKPEKVLDTEYYKRGIFDTIMTIRGGGAEYEENHFISSYGRNADRLRSVLYAKFWRQKHHRARQRTATG
jgi:hypothetical protein